MHTDPLHRRLAAAAAAAAFVACVPAAQAEPFDAERAGSLPFAFSASDVARVVPMPVPSWRRLPPEWLESALPRAAEPDVTVRARRRWSLGSDGVPQWVRWVTGRESLNGSLGPLSTHFGVRRSAGFTPESRARLHPILGLSFQAQPRTRLALEAMTFRVSDGTSGLMLEAGVRHRFIDGLGELRFGIGAGVGSAASEQRVGVSWQVRF